MPSRPIRKIAFIVTAAVVVASGCANPGIVKLSPDTYLLARSDRAGIFGNAATMKAEVIQEASAFAESMGKVAIPLSVKEVPVAPGRFATIEYQFRVVADNDPEARRTSLVPRADVVIEKTERSKIEVEVTGSANNPRDLYTELLKLEDLRKRGILSDAEFESAKKRLLSQQK